MRPLKITADLASEVVNPPMLDALLEWCMSLHVGRDLRLRHADEERADYKPGRLPTPLATRDVPGFAWPVPCCSSPIYCPAGEGVDYITRRADMDPTLLREDARSIHYTTMGEFKSYRLPLATQLVDRVVWFAVGDAGDVRRLLKQVRYIGKKRSIGYGAVAAWTVEDVEADWSWIAESPAGPVLMRPLPTGTRVPDGLLGARQWYQGMTPPYWLAETLAEGVVPC